MLAERGRVHPIVEQGGSVQKGYLFTKWLAKLSFRYLTDPPNGRFKGVIQVKKTKTGDTVSSLKVCGRSTYQRYTKGLHERVKGLVLRGEPPV